MLTTVHKLHLKSKRGGHTKVAAGKRKPVPKSRVPHVAKLTALAIRLDELLQAGEVANRGPAGSAESASPSCFAR